jgi:pyruvate dehydrogenase E1 component beta subunit
MVVEAMRAAAALAEEGIEAEVIDLQSLRPLDDESVLASVRKTGRVLVVDQSWKQGGFAGEIVSLVAEDAFDSLRKPPRRVAMPDVPVPTSAALARFSYPGARDLVAAAYELLDRGVPPIDEMPLLAAPVHLDVPDSSFVGPF